MKRAGEDKFNELHMLVTTELINRYVGEATTADLKAASDWLYKNDITGEAFDTSPLSQLADIMPSVDFDTVQKSVIKHGPRRLPRKQLKRSARNYRDNPESRAKTPITESVTLPKKPSPIGWNLREPVESGAEGKGGGIFHTLNQED